METTFELSRWQGRPRGLAYRRWVIVSTGLRQLFRLRLFRFLLLVGWGAGALIAAAGFVFSQSVGNGGWLESLAANFGPRFEAVTTAFTAVILLYPDLCIHGLFTVIFWLQSFVALGLVLIGLTALIPRLVTQDRASNALAIYLARPLTAADYLLGKLGIVGGFALVVWTGPLLTGWLLSVLLSPNRDFLVYSLRPLGNALLFNGICVVSIAVIAIGVSALNRSSRNTILLWIVLWFVAGVVAGNPNNPGWLRRISFTRDLSDIRKNVFRVDTALIRAADELPVLNKSLKENLRRAGKSTSPEQPMEAAAGLGALMILSSTVFLRKLRPE